MFFNLYSSKFKPHWNLPGSIGNWSAHSPFAADTIEALKRSIVLELGTPNGEPRRIGCQAYAADIRSTDSLGGRPHVFEDGLVDNAEHHQSFPTLRRSEQSESELICGSGLQTRTSGKRPAPWIVTVHGTVQ